MEKIIALIQQEGIVIGVITALIKGIVQIRKRDFNLLIFITDTILAVVMGYVSWELVKDTESINPVVRAIFTVFMSANAFVVVSIITNKDLARKIFLNFFGKILEQDLSDKKKK